METFFQDIRYGLRMLRKTPGFTIVAVLALALGIGANSAIFTVVYALLLRPLPYPEAQRLMVLTEWSKQVPNMSFSVENFKDLRDQNKSFESVVAFRSMNYVWTGQEEPERLQGRQVTSGFFDTMRVNPILGRAFRTDEDQPGAERVVLLGEGLWNRRFAHDPNILGTPLTLNGESFTVVGVLPSDYHGAWRLTELWTSMGRLENQLGGPANRGNHPGIYVIGRLKPGITEEQARSEVGGIAQRLAQQYPNTNAEQSMTLRSLHEAVVGPLKPALLVLMGAVAFVLLIACANVANLLLARATVRQKEVAVRTALGAGRSRLVRQMLTESLLLAFLGGACGLLIAWGGVKGLIAASPENTPRIEEVRLDGWVLLFTMGISVLTGLIFGLVPSLQTSRAATSESLKEGSRGGSSARGRHHARDFLIISEISLALVLLVGAGLMLKSFIRLMDADPGFNPDNVLTLSISLPETKYSEPAKVRDFISRTLENLKSIPEVRYAGSTTPLLGGWQTSFSIQGRPAPPAGKMPSTDIARVAPNYFHAMGLRLLRGRYFTEQDREGSLPVCIIDETMARTYWPAEDPLGKQMRLGGPSPQNRNPWLTVVGVVSHVKNYGVDQESRVETYLPYLQDPRSSFSLVIRTSGEPTSITSAVRQAVRSVDPEVPIFNSRSLHEILSDSVAPQRLAMFLLGVFAMIALLLAAVGIYGVMSYSVTQRTHEIGVRMALGARKPDILRLVVGQGMGLVALGLVIGIGVAFGLTRLMATLLFRVSASDPLTFALIPVLLGIVAFFASYIPARRAMKVDPLVALRYE